MSLSGVFARIVALIGAAAVMWRRLQGTPQLQAVGSAPVIPAAKPQGSIPTLKMPTAQGWARGQTPVAAPGLKVNAFAAGLKHPRWIHLLPNGDVLTAEARMRSRYGRNGIYDVTVTHGDRLVAEFRGRSHQVR